MRLRPIDGARPAPNFIRSGPYAASFAEVSAQAVRDLLAARARARQACERPEGLDESEDSIYGTSIAKQQKELLEKDGVTVVGVGAHNFVRST